jgi:hypothetical protein
MADLIALVGLALLSILIVVYAWFRPAKPPNPNDGWCLTMEPLPPRPLPPRPLPPRIPPEDEEE